ncbi:MAG: B12-binding domain-containing radical SAM protein [Thermodesulfobacteriota bacterium]|nr:B12-binding domain-containing radical SAM protein [Thermodesulfobacteriota bacterium]
MSWLKNILLVYPEIPNNTYWSFHYALQFVNKKSAMPPLGVITMAALLPDKYNLRLVDMNIEPLTEADIQWADAVFVSAMIIQQNSLAGVVDMCNRAGKPVVAGGPYPTSTEDELPGVDHFVLGEAELIIDAFMRDFENGTARRIYRAQERPDITRSVIPRFDLLKMDSYSSMAIQYSRGCPFKCEFCDIWVVYGNRPRLKSSDQVIRELEALKALGWQDAVFIVDDNFIGNKGRVKKDLLPAVIQWQRANNYLFEFYTEASINMADDIELIRMMRKARFGSVFIGIETPSKEALVESHKNQNLKCDLEEAVHTIQQNGIEVMAGFIVGFDSDTDDIFDRQIAFIQKAGIPKAMVGLLHALPGTVLYNRMKNEKRIAGHIAGNNTHTMTTNFQTVMDPRQLKEGYKKVLSTIYDRQLKNYFARCNMLLDNLQGTGFKQRTVRFDEIKSLLKSIFFQPFRPYGRQYIRFVLRNLFKHPDMFAEVITHAIMGHHFYIITQETIKADKAISILEEVDKTARQQLSQLVDAVRHQSSVRGRMKQLYAMWDGWKVRLQEVKDRINHLHGDSRVELLSRYNEVSGQLKEQFAATEETLRYKKAG